MEVEIGLKVQNKSGEWFEVIEDLGQRRYLVRFDRTGFKKSARRDAIINKTVTSPYDLSKHGVGYIGEGNFKTQELREGKLKATAAYSVWSCMMARCYNQKYIEYHLYGGASVSVCDEWRCFQTFAEFFYSKWEKGLQLDKDILKPGNTTYCPEYSRFVPGYINNLLIHQKNVSNGLPVGVFYMKKGPRMVNELKKPYAVEWRKKNLGTFACPLEAHKVWQLNKADHIDETVKKYSFEKCFDKDVAQALLYRSELLRQNAAMGVETKRL